MARREKRRSKRQHLTQPPPRGTESSGRGRVASPTKPTEADGFLVGKPYRPNFFIIGRKYKEDRDGWAEILVDDLLAETDKALLFVVDGKKWWVPKRLIRNVHLWVQSKNFWYWRSRKRYYKAITGWLEVAEWVAMNAGLWS
jgi:hypothetical protein